MSRRPRQICKECLSDAVIVKTERLDKNFSRLYCRCKNPECHHEWVANLEYSHTIKPSRLNDDGLLFYLIKKIPAGDRQRLKQMLDNA